MSALFGCKKKIILNPLSHCRLSEGVFRFTGGFLLTIKSATLAHRKMVSERFFRITTYFHSSKQNIAETRIFETRGRILGGNADKSLKSFPPCYSQSPLQLCLGDFYFFKLEKPLKIATVQLLYTVECRKEENLIENRTPLPMFKKSIQRPQNFAQKNQRNCTFMNSASVRMYIVH